MKICKTLLRFWHEVFFGVCSRNLEKKRYQENLGDSDIIGGEAIFCVLQFSVLLIKPGKTVLE